MSHDETRPVQHHYDTLLAAIYPWMVGDSDVARRRAQHEVDGLGPVRDGAVAVDLGAGLGLHAQALAAGGHRTVWMLDTSAELLAGAQHTTHIDDTSTVHAIHADLTTFRQHVHPGPVDTILCMGDTLPHLTRHAEVARLLDDVAASLRPGGAFLTTFRDYSRPLTGTSRFVPVQADDDRTLTVFLEFDEDTVQVHDVLWQRDQDGWSQQVGSYPKLRLDPEWVAGELQDHGLDVRVSDGLAGMTQITARRPS